jgi:hypothetical protein
MYSFAYLKINSSYVLNTISTSLVLIPINTIYNSLLIALSSSLSNNIENMPNSLMDSYPSQPIIKPALHSTLCIESFTSIY